MESRQVKNKAVYVALGVTPEGEREVLGLWIAANECAKFWISIMNNLKNRGLEDILIAVVDGLKGFPDAINAAYPDTTVQTCIVHLVRHSLNFCSWKDRKDVAKSLKVIYQALDDKAAAKALDDFEEKWGQKYPSIAPSWRRAWQEVIPFFAFPPDVRKIIYTTNAIESLNRVIRKTTKTRGSFPTDDAATKLIYLAIRNFEKKGRVVREWPLGDCMQSPAGNSCSTEPIRYPIPRTVQQMTGSNRMDQTPYTDFRTFPCISAATCAETPCGGWRFPQPF
jgi:transposase-like protein